MLAMRPQTKSGCSMNRSGPGWRPQMKRPAIMTADVGDPGLVGRGDDLADPEEADRDGHEADPREQADLAERQAWLAGDAGEAHRGEGQAQGDHHHRFQRRLRAEADEGGELEEEDREELGRSEVERDVGELL